jgi:hypothetical protein
VRPAQRIRYDRAARRFTGILADDRAAWGRAFPTVAIATELSRAELWLADTTRRYRDFSRFLRNWFRTAERDARGRPGLRALPHPRRVNDAWADRRDAREVAL